MEDSTLKAFPLPAELIIRKFIHGEPDCDYQKYMLEFVNNSFFFRKKAEGEVYEAPPSEECGQCDCISEKYELDFKLIASKTLLQAKSILSMQKTVITKGVTVTESCKVPNTRMETTRIHVALRDYDFDALCELRKKYIKKQGVENDICELLKTLETKKNLILFFPYRFRFDNEYAFLDAVKMIQTAISNDFRCSMQYRNYVAVNYDTYMVYIYDKYIVFMEEKENCFNYIDCVELTKSGVYQNLLRYVE